MLTQADPENAALLKELDDEEIVYAYRFYLADQRRLSRRLSAEEWREEMIATEKPETTEWLRNLSGGDLTRAHRFSLAAKECAATLCEKAEAWREEAIAAIQDPEATEWLRNLNREELIEEYRLDREREQRIEACVVSGKFYNPGFQEQLPENVRLEEMSDWLAIPSIGKTAG